MRKPTQAWMAQARDEFETADILLSSEKYQAVCYHSQQCVEKALKALDTDEAVFLNSVYRGRYPTEEGLLPHGEPTHADAQRAHAAARTLVESVEAVLAPSAESA
jgi:HEPN domain-containing protein